MMVRMDSGQIVLERRLLLLVQLLFSHGIGPRWAVRDVQYGTRSVDIFNADLHCSLGDGREKLCLHLSIVCYVVVCEPLEQVREPPVGPSSFFSQFLLQTHAESEACT